MTISSQPALIGLDWGTSSLAAADVIDATTKAAAFARGLAVARDSGPEGIAGRLFTTRSLSLTGQFQPSATLDYLSGLLVGEEIRSAVAGSRLHVRLRVSSAGLWEIARRAGLVSAARDSSGSATHG